MQDPLFQQAYQAHMAGDTPTAQGLYARLVKQQPKHIDARYLLGTLLAEQGELDSALEQLKGAARLMPGSPMIQTNLGNVYLKLGKLTQACDCYQRALKSNPGVAETHFNLGLAQQQLGQLAQAIHSFEHSIRLQPDFTVALRRLAEVYKDCGRPQQAIHCLLKLHQQSPDDLGTLFDLGNALAALQQIEQALIYFQRILALEPTNPSAQHAVAALSGQTTTAAPITHVANLFDELSDRFEAHLGQLGYQAPALFQRMLGELAGDQARFNHTLDLGCGTGLSGLPFRAISTRLTGLDISPRMVELARNKGIYDELVTGDIVSYLNNSADHYDLIIAADVLAYIGDLAPIFAIISQHHTAGGYLLFSTEQSEQADYILHTTGRYAHSQGYIQALADNFGYTVAACQPTDLRMEGDIPIRADLFILQRQHSPAT